ncbi:MAG TPA: glycoside hydrolase family 57 protein [Terriglobales bacterium]|jgi:alpha-amylase/alpha-mannosidase (GH57 family)|nr:glycoside hydrolase family 57 protein [Terriglobales bacterium]
MAQIRVVVLWHQHQPFYKDLVTGRYRLPWTRLHALKDYYGMVKLLDEFPNVHQTFNLVPSLVTQIQDYVVGEAQDPFLQVAATPVKELSPDERRFALQYLFQAHPVNVIGRYPRYHELLERFHSAGDSPDRAEKQFQPQDFTDLQVLSQVAWFDEYFLQEKEISELVRKERNYSLDDQRFVIATERELLGRVIPVHADAAKRGLIEISTSPFYHPILPLVCDTQAGAASSPGLPLPQIRFCHPEDAREQLLRGLDFHEKVFGMRPTGVWPSEGSVSEETLAIAHRLGVEWMATDEGVLGRTLGLHFSRDGHGRLSPDLAHRLYTIHRYENADTRMNLIFRDHTLSDLIGFVYSGMPPQDAANNLIQKIKESAQPLISHGRDAMIPIILDGENAWEYYPRSGRDFLRRFYDGLSKDPGIEAVTVSEAIARQQNFGTLKSLVPGSWINANFNVWIGAPEDNKAWDYLSRARDFYAEKSASATEGQRNLAFEEILIAEGSDWNWWYGPEHHSANDRDFDELYRKHLSNVYQALGGTPPDYLAQPIAGAAARPSFTAQSAYIHPRVAGDMVRYFEWMGAARYTSDRRSGSMHGKQFLLDAVHAGIDEHSVYGRMDFIGGVPEDEFEIVVNLESWETSGSVPRRELRLEAAVKNCQMQSWKVTGRAGSEVLVSSKDPGEVRAALGRNFEFRLPLAWLQAEPLPIERVRNSQNSGVPTRLRLRFSLWSNRLPVDALPVEGWIELDLLREEDLVG